MPLTINLTRGIVDTMITGAHFLLYSTDPDADRRFMGEVLGLRSVDAGDGWLIFALPPSEIAVHPASENFVQRHSGHALAGNILYLMCDDLHSTIAELERKGASTSEVQTAGWGIMTTIQLPSGCEIGLYQPRHVTALETRTGRVPSNA